MDSKERSGASARACVRDTACHASGYFQMEGPTAHLTRQSKGIAAENRWYSLRRRVVDLKVEADGDIHIALKDATGRKPGIVGVEVPAKLKWCPIRKRVFSWTRTKFPFRVQTGKTLKMTEAPIITVTGKAFFDVDHAPKDHSNRRTNLPGYAAWEIHPVMKLKVSESRFSSLAFVRPNG